MESEGWSKDSVAVVSGANRGIGFEMVRMFAEQGLTVVLTARSEARGQAAVDELQGKGLKTIVFHPLDPTDAKSVESLATWLKFEYGGIDILAKRTLICPGAHSNCIAFELKPELQIHNAAMISSTFDYEAAKSVMDLNYYGVKHLNAALLPILRSSSKGARIVIVTARSGLYERLPSESLKKIFRDEENNYSEKLADSLAEKYLADMKARRTEEEGWMPNEPGNNNIYSESKMFLNVYANGLAKWLDRSRIEGSEIFVAGMCPGACRTEMMQDSINNGFVLPDVFPMKTAAEGAETAVWLALLPKDEWQGKTGRFFAEKREWPFGWKNPPL